jgi:hypothetical protein
MAENGFDLDARIQRQTERHEALAESVELLIAGIEALKGTVERQHGKIALLARSRARTTARHRVPSTAPRPLGERRREASVMIRNNCVAVN